MTKEQRMQDAAPDLYRALQRSLGIIVEFGDLNGFRNLSNAELGKLVRATAEEAGNALNKVDGLIYDPALLASGK